MVYGQTAEKLNVGSNSCWPILGHLVAKWGAIGAPFWQLARCRVQCKGNDLAHPIRSYLVKILGRMAVFPEIPERIQRLRELAYNLWWTWNPSAQRLYATISPELWQSSEHNAVRVLLEVDPARLAALATDGDFLARYDAVCVDFDAYLHPSATWFSQTFPSEADHTIAYFSAEFGLHESLPIYSGGLGILSGDHCKEASDLGLPFIGVGFLYPQGYFRQRITARGQQEALYEKLHFSQVPAQPAMDTEGHEVMISVDLPGRKVYAKVWRIQVGRIPLYLMDTDVEPNTPGDRVLSARLYGGDHEMRIAQEIMLGIGGVRALRALGLDPMVWHMNEGHAAFLELERCRELVQGMDIDFEVAREIAAANAVFTTHTPVAAGNDAFNFELVDTLFRRLLATTAARPRRVPRSCPRRKRLGEALQHDGAGAAALDAAQRRQPVARRRLAPDVAVPLARTGGRRDADHLHHQRCAYRDLAGPGDGRSLSALPGRGLVRPPGRSGALGARARDSRRGAVGHAQPAQRGSAGLCAHAAGAPARRLGEGPLAMRETLRCSIPTR